MILVWKDEIGTFVKNLRSNAASCATFGNETCRLVLLFCRKMAATAGKTAKLFVARLPWTASRGMFKFK